VAKSSPACSPIDPVRIGGREYVDGGLASPANADLAGLTAVDVVVCLNPLARRPPLRNLHPAAPFDALIRDSACRQLDYEIAGLEAMGIEVLRFEPGPDELAVTGFDPMDPGFCLEIATRAAYHARDRVRELGMAKALRYQAA